MLHLITCLGRIMPPLAELLFFYFLSKQNLRFHVNCLLSHELHEMSIFTFLGIIKNIECYMLQFPKTSLGLNIREEMPGQA